MERYVRSGEIRVLCSTSTLASAENLFHLASDPPAVLIDQKQNLFFYQGYPVRLAPTTFSLMALLARRPGQFITKEEIYTHLWPEFSNPDVSFNPGPLTP